ncbi:hypothetical protein P4200_08155 [Pseudomonas aeruginosa]|nr:hypothetical protein [Pseudomonas aeruginosa]
MEAKKAKQASRSFLFFIGNQDAKNLHCSMCRTIGLFAPYTTNSCSPHIRGRRGGKLTPQTELDLAGVLSGFLSTGKIRSAKRQLIVSEVQRISEFRQQLQFTGAPSVDWLHLRGLLASSTAEALRQVATDARYLRLLHQGWYCAPTWATCGVPKWVQGG